MQHQGELHRIIVEVTNRCNLDCSICLRQSWNGKLGDMSPAVFSTLVRSLKEFPSPPEIFFGGYGEPLSHPHILEILQQIATTGCQLSLITNGTILTTQLLELLVEAGLQKLWISADSSHQDALLHSPASQNQPEVLTLLGDILQQGNGMLEKLQLGLAFVLTNNNQTEMMKWIDQGHEIGVRSYFITNLEAYTPTQAKELPYTLGQLHQPGSWRRGSNGLLGKIDEITANDPDVSIDGALTHHRDRCPFAERGDLVLRWDGEISPCLPLLYDRTTYIDSWEHKQFSYSLGNILDHSLTEIRADAKHICLRKNLLDKEFSPCLYCRDCWFSNDNRQDCQGFEHPTCGGCLWAEGLIDCP